MNRPVHFASRWQMNKVNHGGVRVNPWWFIAGLLKGKK